MEPIKQTSVKKMSVAIELPNEDYIRIGKDGEDIVIRFGDNLYIFNDFAEMARVICNSGWPGIYSPKN